MLLWLCKVWEAIPVWVWELLFVLCLLAGGFWNGKIQYWRGEHAQLAKEKTAEQKYAAQSQAISVKVQTVYVDRVKTVQLAGQTIIKKVPIYVTKIDDSKCTINNGFVSLWNSANQMSVPPAASSVDEIPSPIVLSEVATEHAREAEQYHLLYEQLIALQSWIQQEQKLK